MTSRRNTPPPSEAAARHFAEKGIAGIEQVQAIVDRAREMLATGEVAPPPDGEDPHWPQPYRWEVTGVRSDMPRRVWTNSVEDFATGEGLTVHFAAALAQSEAEFKQRLSLELGGLARQAEIGIGLEGIPQAALFVSPHLRAMLERFDSGGVRPATMTLFARYDANYS